MYQPLTALFHSFLNQFQRDGEFSHSSLKQANKPLCFLSILLSNNTGFPRASCPTCPGSSPPGIRASFPFPIPTGWVGLAVGAGLPVVGSQLASGSWQGPFYPLLPPLVFTADFPKNASQFHAGSSS